MTPNNKTLAVTALSVVAVLTALFAARDEIYFSLNHDQMVEMLNDKHLSNLLETPNNGKDQERIIGQIRLLRASRWNSFISTEQSKLLDDKVSQLKEGIERRMLLYEINSEEEIALDRSAALKKQILENKGKLNATVTRFLLDAPPRVTEGEATYNETGGYLDFYDEINSGHRYNHRCFRSGSVSESDSIITKDSWEKEPDYSCSMDIGPSGVPMTVAVKSLMNNGFVAMRGTFTIKYKQTMQAAKPEHCSVTISNKRLIVDQLAAEKITAAEGRSKFAAIREKVKQCYQST